MGEQIPDGAEIKEADWATLTDLFVRSEGASLPLAPEPKQARADFHILIERLYEELVASEKRGTLPLSAFKSYVRLVCRKRAQRPPSCP